MNGSRFKSPSPTREGIGEGVSPQGDSLRRERVRALRTNATIAERTLWRHLRMKQIRDARFRRQFPIGVYIVDFVCLKARLVVELDGGQHGANAAYDDARSRWLESLGFEVIRFWNSDVLESTEGVVNEIAARVEARLEALGRDGGTPSSRSSRVGEEDMKDVKAVRCPGGIGCARRRPRCAAGRRSACLRGRAPGRPGRRTWRLPRAPR